METLKNFLVGLFVTLLALCILAFGFLFLRLCPLVLGIGLGIVSVLLFVAVIVFAVILAFYIVVLVGHVVRKGIAHSGEGGKRKNK